jgi:hypothetical protein
MTEAEWLVCTRPTPMLQFVQARVSPRKLRLFAAGCCRRIWALLPDERSRRAVETAEWFADGTATAEQLAAARQVALAAADRSYGGDPAVFAADANADTAAWYTPVAAANRECSARLRTSSRSAWNTANKAAEAWQAALFRCLVGDPFRPVPRAKQRRRWQAWNNGTVVKLAQAIYDERAFANLPVLADALEEAGCQDADVLAHCRQPGEHVRGCWVVDVILGKS